MKDRASHDGKGSVPHTSADISLRSTFPARSAASRAVRHASLEKRAFVPQDKSSFFVYHVNTSDQFPSWWHKTVPQRSGHSFEARSSGASSHFVPLHHDPATRSRCRSEETPRPAKRPRRKAGARAKRGVSELCFRYTIDEHITVTDFCNLFFRLVFTRNLIGRFNQICHDLIELRGVF